MAQIPIKIPAIGEAASASYDYVDLANGLGYTPFYLGQSEDTTNGKEYLLTDSTLIKSSEISRLGYSEELNFDSSGFNLSRTVKGTAYVSLVGGTNTANQSSVTVILYKVTVAAEEVPLSSSLVMTHAATGGIYYLIQLPLTETIIKRGEKLRLSVTTTDPATGAAAIGIDPAGRTFNIDAAENYDSQSKILVPFRIDI